MILIAALGINGIIGSNGTMPWRLKSDLARFKKLTINNTVVMGRKTFNSIGRPLSDRKNVVISRDNSFKHNGVEVINSIDCIEDVDNQFIIGGGEIYSQTIKRATMLYLTIVSATPIGDTYFPSIDKHEWNLVDFEPHLADVDNDHDYSFIALKRILR